MWHRSLFLLRFLFAAHPLAMGKVRVLGIVCRAIATPLSHGARYSIKEGATGAVTLIQRFAKVFREVAGPLWLLTLPFASVSVAEVFKMCRWSHRWGWLSQTKLALTINPATINRLVPQILTVVSAHRPLRWHDKGVRLKNLNCCKIGKRTMQDYKRVLDRERAKEEEQRAARAEN